MSTAEKVIADVQIFSIDLKDKFKCQIEFKILSVLDNKDYSLIIGHPDIVKYNLLDKFASQWRSETNIDIGGGAEKFHGHVTAHSEPTPQHVAVVRETIPSDDMLNSITSLGSQQYDEDEEVIPYEHWDDAWQKNDSDNFKKEDIIETIMNNVESKNSEFKMRTRHF